MGAPMPFLAPPMNIMYDFESIVLAKSIDEAITALNQSPEAMVIAGGSDVLIQIREGKHAGKPLVSIFGIKQLEGVRLEDDGTIFIGPITTFAGVTESPVIQKHIPTLGFATDQAGGPQLRNTGTIGGNICNGVTSADSAPTLLTLNAELEITGSGGVRRVPQEDFYEGPGRVKMQHGELLTGVRIYKKDYENFYGHYIKFAQRNAMDIATLGTAAHVKLSEDKKHVAELRLAFGVAGPTPIRCHVTEEKAAGMPLDEQLLTTVGETALTEVNPRTSWRASKEFRQQLVYENSRRAVREAIIKAGGAMA